MDRKSAMKKLSLIAALLVSVVIFTGEASAQGRITRPTKPKTETEQKTESKTQNKSRPASSLPKLSLEEMYQKGVDACRKGQYAEAARWYRKAAEQGHATAQCNLGYMYDDGLGVAKDYSEAARWYRKAAEQGDMYAQFNLGEKYYYGQGVSKDYSEALKWYRKAAHHGYWEAIDKLKELGEDR